MSNSESGDPGSNPVNVIKPPVSETTYTFVVTMSGGSLTTSPTIPTGPSQDQPTPDDGWRSNWSKRRVQSNATDEDESPNNYNALHFYDLPDEVVASLESASQELQVLFHDSCFH